MTLASAGEGLTKMLMRPKRKKKGKPDIKRDLNELVRRNVLMKHHVLAWMKVRDEVMHGNLISPWATQEQDQHIDALADLVHCITRELIAEHLKPKANAVPAS